MKHPCNSLCPRLECYPKKHLLFTILRSANLLLCCIIAGQIIVANVPEMYPFTSNHSRYYFLVLISIFSVRAQIIVFIADRIQSATCCILHFLTPHIFFHLAEIFENANKFCHIDIGPSKNGHLTSLCKRSFESKRIPQMNLHDVPHRKYDKMLAL
jgi:hypothetical protein